VKAGTLAGRGFEADGAAVVVDDLGDDRETKAYAFFF
jgi:hypothetical protein